MTESVQSYIKQNDKKRRTQRGVNLAVRSAVALGTTLALLISGAQHGISIASPRADLSGVSLQSGTQTQQQAHQPSSQQQQQEQPNTDANARAGQQQQEGRAARWRVRVAADANPLTLQVRVNNVLLTEIAADIARQLRVPVTVSPALRQHRVTLKGDDVLLEAALRAFAPRAYIDYVVAGESAGMPPRLKAIYLYAVEEPAPDAETGFTSTGGGITIIEGNTNDMIDDGAASNAATQQQTSGEAKEPPLSVSYTDNKLSVRARRQPLTMVLFEIASAVKVPLDMQLESGQLVDVDFKDYGLEQAVRLLPAKAQLHLRTDLQTMTSTPLRFVLAAK